MDNTQTPQTTTVDSVQLALLIAKATDADAIIDNVIAALGEGQALLMNLIDGQGNLDMMKAAKALPELKKNKLFSEKLPSVIQSVASYNKNYRA